MDGYKFSCTRLLNYTVDASLCRWPERFAEFWVRVVAGWMSMNTGRRYLCRGEARACTMYTWPRGRPDVTPFDTQNRTREHSFSDEMDSLLLTSDWKCSVNSDPDGRHGREAKRVSSIYIYKVAASVCLCVCLPDFWKTCGPISTKLFMVYRCHR